MKRSILTPMVLLMFLCALLLPGCNRPTPSTSGSTPQAALPETTPTVTAPTDPTDPNPLVTVYLLSGCVYDEAGQQKALSFVYDDAGVLLQVSIGTEVVVLYTYDAQGNCLAYKNTLRGIDQTYDAQGRLLTDRTEDGIITQYLDEAGRYISVEHHSADGALLSATRYTYDDQGNLISEVLEQDGAIHHEILHTYDDKGLHLTATYCRDGVISAEGPSYVWAYDSLGHLESENIYYGENFFQGTLFYYIKSADQTLAYMQWDSSGRFSEYTHFFDMDGNLTGYEERTKDAEGNRYSISFKYSYDAHGNTIMRKEVDRFGQEHIYQWVYDETGFVMTNCTLTSPDESYAYSWIYDESGLLVQEIRTGDAPYEITWEYDRRGRVLSEVCSGSSVWEITYVYDEFGNLIQRSNTADSTTTVITYTYTTLTVMPEVAEQMQALQAQLLQQLHSDTDGVE